MSRPASKTASGSGSTVSPPPSLAANGARHRSGGNYVKSYGRSSFELQQQQQQKKTTTKATTQPPSPQPTAAAPLQPSQQPLHSFPQESLRRIHSKPGIRSGRQQQPSHAALSDPAFASLSDESGIFEWQSSNDVDVSALTTPAQSYVPEKRRRGCGAAQPGSSPTAFSSDTGAFRTASTTTNITPSASAATTTQVVPASLLADKENTNVTARVGVPAKSPPSHPPASLPSTASSSASPTVLYRRTASGTRGGRSGGAGGTAPPRRAPSMKSRPGSAGVMAVPRKAAPTTTTPAAAAAGSSQLDAAVSGTPQRCSESPPPTPPPHMKVSGHVTPRGAATTPPPPPSNPQSSATTVVQPKQQQQQEQQQRMPQRAPMDWCLREQLDTAESVLAYVAEVQQALGERRRCGAPPASTDDFRASVVPCRRRAAAAHRAGQRSSPDCEEEERCDDGGAAPQGSVALLPDLHRAASSLLSAFTKLEYAQLSDDVDVHALESDVVNHSARLVSLVDGVARQLSLQESAEVRRLAAGHRDSFVQTRHLVEFMSRMAQQMALLRSIAAQHDVAEAREVWQSFHRSVERQEAQEQEARQASQLRRRDDEREDDTLPAAHAFAFSPLRMMQESPFFQRLERRWLPAMAAWRLLVADATDAVLHNHSNSGDGDDDDDDSVEVVLRRSRQEALNIAGLQEILRPGETVAALHKEQIASPILRIKESQLERRAALNALRRAVQEPELLTVESLSAAVKAAAALQPKKTEKGISGSRDGTRPHSATQVDAEKEEAAALLLARAEELLVKLRDVERLQQSMSALLLTPSPELTALLELITRANATLLEWQLPHDKSAAQHALAVTQAALNRVGFPAGPPSSRDSAWADALQTPDGRLGGLHSTPPPPSSSAATAGGWLGDALPPGFNVRMLHLPHATRSPWTTEMDVLYRELCDVFAMLFTQQQAQWQLEKALGNGAREETHVEKDRGSAGVRAMYGGSVTPSAGGAAAAGYVTPSPQHTPHRLTYGTDSPANTRPSSEEGSPRFALTGRSSGDSLRSALQQQQLPASHSYPSTSVAELRRRLQQAEEAGIAGALLEAARAQLQRLLTVRLKIHFDAQTRVLPIANAAEACFAEVYEQVHAHCQAQLLQTSSSPPPPAPVQPVRVSGALTDDGCGGDANSASASPAGVSPWSDRRLRIRYEDSDGDFISLLTQQDWDAMLAELCHDDGTAGKVELFCDYPIQPSSTPGPEVVGGEDDGLYEGEHSAEKDRRAHATTVAAGGGGGAAAAKVTPEKQANVFARLASSKDTAASAAAAANGRGGNGGANRVPRGRPRLGVPAGASPQHGAAPRSRSGGAGTGRTGLSPGKAGASPSAKKPSGAAELTADNLRRNVFQSPASTEGRRSGNSAGRSSGGRKSAAGGAPRTSGTRAEARDATAPATAEGGSAAPDTIATAHDSQQQQVSSTHETDKANGRRGELQQQQQHRQEDSACGPLSSNGETSAVRLDVDGARRWDSAADDADELQLLEIQTRASVSTVRMDPCLSATSFEATPSMSGGIPPPLTRGPAAAAAAATSPHSLKEGTSKNTFTTSHCSRRTKIGDGAAGTSTTPTDSGTSTAAAAATTSSSSAGAAKPEAAEPAPRAAVVGQRRAALSPPRGAPRRWNSDDFSLDEVATVCSDTSRMAAQPIVARGPQTLPPRPRTPTAAAASSSASGSPAGNGQAVSPQRGRRGARGTPTRGRPEGASGGALVEERAESAQDVFAEMQRMREENSRAMAQPRKQVWH